MGVMIDVNTRFWNDKTQQEEVGWPIPVTKQELWANERIAQMAPELAAAGFSVVRMPPSTIGGGGILSDGYDKKDDYILDGTAFGSGEMLRQCIATLHANGLQVYGDLVLHQYGGGNNGVYPSKRFPKTPSCFVGSPPCVGVDDVPDQQGNFPFGDMASYQHSIPPGYMHDGAIKAAQWLVRTTDFDGLRIDEAKGTYAPVVYDILQAAGMQQLFAVGEYFDGSNDPLWKWVHTSMRGRASVLDFGFKFNVGHICNNNSNSWMGRLAEIGYCSIDPTNAVTFVESADTDTSIGQQTIWNKLLGYAIMLTFPGYPCVYYRDWAVGPNCYGLKAPITNLVWIHEHLANGDFVVRHSSFQVFAHERMGLSGKPGLIAFFNNDQWNAYTVTIDTSHPANTRLHEYSGNYNTDVWTDSQGRITVTVPRNNNGHSYLVFSVWVAPAAFPIRSRSTRQEIECAGDLRTGVILNKPVVFGRVSCVAGSSISVSLTADQTNWGKDTVISYRMIGPDGNSVPLKSNTLTKTNSQSLANGTVEISGWHSIEITGANLPSSGSAAKATLTYMGPRVAIF